MRSGKPPKAVETAEKNAGDFTDEIAARLLAMPPKPHEDMKAGRTKLPSGQTRAKKAAKPRRRPQ